MEIRKLLVANRGEIAARIFRTCGRLGIATVAVEAPDDEGAFHTRRGGEVVPVGSYLSATDLVDAARRVEADAVHPGYGFLAESVDFAEAVRAAGLVFVGPSPEAIGATGDKLEAKRLAGAAGVPVLPTGDPAEVGYPLIVKAAGGGGGRGMRVVRDPSELDEALAAAAREAKAAFGDERVFCERYLERPRHVEVQLLADGHGTVLHLGERECSIQRRHQKVLEESPSAALDDDLRAAVGEAAVALARAVGYENAGTAEFVVADGECFFLELNARIQVEHPVTELVTGVDLVEQQLRIASGERLALDVGAAEGHAVEVRLYAEDPLTFLPQAGRLELLELPDTVRVDAGVEAGDAVPVAYDPLIAKLIAHAGSREEALDTLSGALRATRVAGTTTNLGFLRWLVDHPEVRAGLTTTAFLRDNPPLSRARAAPLHWAGAWRLNRDHEDAVTAMSVPPTVETTAHAASGAHEASALTAPMPGVVIRVLARPGDRVEPRQPLVLLEAMKMETPLVSPHAAVVRRVHVAEGDRVAGGALLVELEE
ncbi:MAG TPA: biotin carboxylase N-terminal domain-containing protein [Gaiellaceae bacterium]|nr:biotin carboxylase N-terminal domain-containing protein [Gaiellaceae bacterium]